MLIKEKLLKDVLEEIRGPVATLTRHLEKTEKEMLTLAMPRMKIVSDKLLRVNLDRPRMTHPQKVLAILREIYRDLTDGQEYAYLITLDQHLRFINAWSVGQGGSDHVVIDRAQVFRRVLASDDASAFIVAHNHPSGNHEPSDEDFIMLEDLKRGALYLERPMRDFIILADGSDKYYSHRDQGYEL